MPIKVTITDDHPLVVSGLQNILQAFHHIEIVSTFTSGVALLQSLKNEQPDVLLLDIQMPEIMGDELARLIHKDYPEIRVLILTGSEDAFHAQDMIMHGCMGYLLKNTTDQNILVQAIEQVYEGKMFLEPSLKEELLYDILKLKKQVRELTPTITRREREVLQLVVAAHSNQQIADKLFLSVRTIEGHRLSLLQKLNVKNTAGLIKKALQMGLIAQ